MGAYLCAWLLRSVPRASLGRRGNLSAGRVEANVVVDLLFVALIEFCLDVSGRLIHRRSAVDQGLKFINRDINLSVYAKRGR